MLEAKSEKKIEELTDAHVQKFGDWEHLTTWQGLIAMFWGNIFTGRSHDPVR